jgi:uncharacterized protein (TIRG00374 family)
MKLFSGTNESVPVEESDKSTSKPSPWGLRSWQLWIGVVFSLIFLGLTLQNVNLSETAASLAHVNGLLLCVAVVSYVGSIAAKAVRWRLLLTSKVPSYFRVFSILSIGQMMNAFIPAHLGEFARAYLMGEAESDSKVYVLGTVAVERTADLLFLLISLLLLLSQMILPDWLALPARDTSIVILLLVPIIIILVWKRDLILRMVRWASKFTPVAWRDWLIRQAAFGLASLDAIRRPRLLVGLFFWSTIIYLVSSLTNYLVILALGLTLPMWSSLLLLVVLQIGTAVPSSPGRIGVFQYLVILALSIYSLDKNIALGYSILLYLVIYIPITLIGVYCLWREKITWKTLEDAAAMLKRLKNKAT